MLNTSNARPFIRRALVLAGVALAAACAPAPAAAPPAPAPAPPAPPATRPPAPVTAGLPAMPLVTGPLAIDVVYPPEGDVVPPGDSAMIFGSVGNGNAFLTINGNPVAVWPNGAFMAFMPVPPRTNPVYELVATADGEIARLVHPVRYPVPDTTRVVRPPDTLSGRWAMVRPAPDAHPDRVIWGRTIPGRDPVTYFFFLPGAMVRVTGQSGANLRVALDSGQEIQMPAADLGIEPAGFVPPARTAGAPRVTPAADWVDVAIPVSSTPPYLFESDGNVLRLTLFGTTAAAGALAGGAAPALRPGDPLLTSVERSHTDSRSVYTFTLSRTVFGYTPMWNNGEFVVRIRRHPVVDPAAPLRGLTIAIDPGHPGLPGESPGATGPTRLREPDAVLAVGLRVQEHLAQRGAYVVMTRATPDPVALNARAAIGERSNAHAFVSLHLDAVPGNVNPFTQQGTLTIYWHGHARRLAHHTQQALLRHMHLRDRGLRRDYFAMIRSPWMPSILAEGAFIIMPDQEYALRTPEYQDAYARAVVEGLEAYFAEVAADR